MKAFLAIKYYDDMRNKGLIESICKNFESQKMDVFAFARNIQKYDANSFSGQNVMKIAFEEIKKTDIFIIDASEMSIGIGLEAGVAYCNNIPIYLIARKGCYVSNSIREIAKKSYFYSSPEELSVWKIFD